jgi:hypothetical protein
MAGALKEDRNGHSLEKIAAWGIVPWDEGMPECIKLLFALHFMESPGTQQAPDELKIMRTTR